jgi:hypothetical protein
MKQSESTLQSAVISYLKAVLPRTVRAFAVPNARAFGQPGLTKGIPDICIVRHGGLVAFIELKFGKGKLTSEQAEFLDWCASMGIPAAVCRSLDDVKVRLAAWAIETREAA